MATKKMFNFKLGESGEVLGRAHYTNANPSYLIRYKGGDGRAVESWWAEDAPAGSTSASAGG